jgi:hypothetical protein
LPVVCFEGRVSCNKKGPNFVGPWLSLKRSGWLPCLLPYQGRAIITLITHVEALANMPLLDLLFDEGERRHDRAALIVYVLFSEVAVFAALLERVAILSPSTNSC